jgi:hypothetical protein
MAAGLGFKTFTTGEVLTAGDVNGYLMQGINVFATTAARDAAITAPAEGQFAFTKDTNGLWYYDGAAWVASGATGDIEGVTAGVGISGGGTSGTVTVTNSMATAIDAKGDLVPGTGADTFSRLAVGANGTVLTADSAEATGLKWAAASSGAMTLISTTTLASTASTITFSSIPSTYQHLKIIVSATGTNDFMRMYFNNVTTSTYYSQYVTSYDTNVVSGQSLGVNSMRCGLKDVTSASIIDIPDYKNTTVRKMMTAVSGYRGSTASTATRTLQFFGTNDATDAITQIDITSDTVFGIGTVISLYGVS